MSIQTPVLVYGLGKSGKAALRLLQNLGVPTAQIVVVDEQASAAEIDGIVIRKKLESSEKFATLVVSPGVSLAKLEIKAAIAGGSCLESELSLAVRSLQGEKIIGITGSMGKSTTSALVHCGIQASGHDVFLGGNFGTPLAEYVSDVLEKKRGRAEYLVLELSSYQLENAGDLAPEVSAIVSLAANHLERYDSIQHYYEAKLDLIRRTKKFVVVGSRSPDLTALHAQPGAFDRYLGGRKILIQRCDSAENQKRLASIVGSAKLPGEHNQDNLLIAAQILADLGLPDSQLKKALTALYTFEGLEHRLENLGLRKGIESFNDSKATSITSVHRAIETLRQARPGCKIHCLVGGRDKKLPWRTLGDFPGRESVRFYFFGECAELAQRDSGLPGDHFAKLGPAIESSVKRAGPSEIVLLSPGGTSLDEFANFEKRGDYFKMKIKELLGSPA